MGGVCGSAGMLRAGKLADRLSSQHSILPVSTQRNNIRSLFHKYPPRRRTAQYSPVDVTLLPLLSAPCLSCQVGTRVKSS